MRVETPLANKLITPGELRLIIQDFYEITKPRIAFLVLITTFTGMWLSAGGVPEAKLVLFTLIGVGLASASSATLNNYIDREIDCHMERTKNRPLPSGRMLPITALTYGLCLGSLSFTILLSQVNLLTALLGVLTNFFYVVIYTIWLKRSSTLNTAIGGVAGALPAVLGVTAVTGEITPVAIALFAIMFVWQPPHFWALALIKKEEYRKVNIPMLPVVKGDAFTKRHMLIYTLVLLPVSTSLFFLGTTGWIYLATALILSSMFIYKTYQFRKEDVTRENAYRLFFFSIIYLCVLFVIMFVDCQV